MLPFSEYELAQKIAEEIAGGNPVPGLGNTRLPGCLLVVVAGGTVKLVADHLLDAAGEQQARVGGVQVRVSDFSHFGFLVGFFVAMEALSTAAVISLAETR